MSSLNEKINNPKPPKPPTLTEMIKTIGTRVHTIFDEIRHFRDVLESVAAESGKIYNRFASSEDRRERQLEQKIDRLEGEIQAHRQTVDYFRLHNAYLKGRLSTLEQVSKVEPIPAPVVEEPPRPFHPNNPTNW